METTKSVTRNTSKNEKLQILEQENKRLREELEETNVILENSNESLYYARQRIKELENQLSEIKNIKRHITQLEQQLEDTKMILQDTNKALTLAEDRIKELEKQLKEKNKT